jgi:ribosomal protein S12 methylthiotransferase
MSSENTITVLPDAPKVGMVSLGCPKALVDPERISRVCAPMAMP